jgi:hypothetical protein
MSAVPGLLYQECTVHSWPLQGGLMNKVTSMMKQIAEIRDKLERDLAHMSLIDALDQAAVMDGEKVLAEFHYKGALDTTWFKVHRLSNGQGMIAQSLVLKPQVTKLNGQDIVVECVNKGNTPERLESWFSVEALKFSARFTGRIRSI